MNSAFPMHAARMHVHSLVPGSVHFRDNWQGTPFKAQLVTQDKSTALLYKKFLDEFGVVTSDVLISGPDSRTGFLLPGSGVCFHGETFRVISSG